MKFLKLTTLTLLTISILSACNSQPETAESYPSKAITIVCPWSTGGGTDQCSRFWADQLQQKLGSPVIVQNKTGGSGAIGHSAVARAKPDGYTLGMVTVELSMVQQMGISPLTYRDFTCLMQINADAAALVVRKDAKWNTVQEFLDDVKSSPEKLKMSGTASGGIWDLARVGMLQAAGLEPNSTIWVPSQGAGPAILQLLGNHIDALCVSVPEAMPQVTAGELKVLGVMADLRLQEFPDIPTLKEQGVDWSAVGWRGLALPKETPEFIVTVLQKHCQEIADSNEFKEFMKTQGFAVVVRNSTEFTAFLEQQESQWSPVIQAAGYANKVD